MRRSFVTGGLWLAALILPLAALPSLAHASVSQHAHALGSLAIVGAVGFLDWTKVLAAGEEVYDTLGRIADYLETQLKHVPQALADAGTLRALVVGASAVANSPAAATQSGAHVVTAGSVAVAAAAIGAAADPSISPIGSAPSFQLQPPGSVQATSPIDYDALARAVLRIGGVPSSAPLAPVSAAAPPVAPAATPISPSANAVGVSPNDLGNMYGAEPAPPAPAAPAAPSYP